MRLLIYSRPGCHLCEDAKAVLQRVGAEYGANVEEINIENDPQAFEKYRYEIPVVFLEDVKLFKFRVEEDLLLKALKSSLK
jgi:glutaredoxin